MKADEMALENARQIKAYCKAQDDCEDCVFIESEDICFFDKCKLTDYNPCDWKLDKE